MQERNLNTLPGIPVLLLLLLAMAGIGLTMGSDPMPMLVAKIVALVVLSVALVGLFMVQPNQGVVLQLFGRYVGTARDNGLRWANPFYSKKAVTLRVRNFESSKLKVNDLDGSPIEIAAVVVWQVHETAEAVFNVDDYENFVHVQSEAALRQMATSYPYDLHEDHKVALRSHSTEINEHLQQEIKERLQKAGVTVIEARVSHLAYAAEIAQAMLQRQQAGAIIAARTRIVEGAVSMVHMALEQLAQKGVVNLDEERKAAMVSNLLVVLCGERGTQPIVNTGTIY
ncbi:MAG TPA: SPFH domain-containing protein [Pseudomonadota bacterium]|nr:SPFH domain-containing protein [Xanthomonadales bacterium]MBP8177324.1 SPFH domain-containing protein [Xanthomonadales bacterium]HQX25944.1 SPFH domain-containing protein [Pseudomonadota bacterium]HQY37487.1 SPFH domain-containing protein [Pseudomonadota bacterium]HRA36453.1 SPFH domain-containing protein [Pseudomonadota bacterium]